MHYVYSVLIGRIFSSNIQSSSLQQVIIMKGSNYCGYLSIIYFIECTNLQQVRLFNKRYPSKDFTESTWTKKRRTVRKHLLNAVSYKNDNKGREKESFIEYFSKSNYQKLPAEERQHHKLVGCQQCWISHCEQFLLKRNNKGGQHLAHSNDDNTACNLSVRAEQAFHAIASKTPEKISDKDVENVMKCIIRPIKKVIKSTPHSGKFLNKILGKNKIHDVSLISKQARRQILKEENNALKDASLVRDHLALFSSKQSGAEWDWQNKDLYGERRINKPKQHTGNIEKFYKYSKEALCHALNTEQVDNWTELGRRINLVRCDSQLPPGNMAQVSCNQKFFVFLTTNLYYLM